MDSSDLQSVRNIFSILGFESNLRPRKVSILYLNLLWLTLNVIIFIFYHDAIIYTKDFIGEACDMLKILFAFASWACGIYVSMQYPKVQDKLSDCFTKMEQLTSTFYVNPVDSFQKFSKNFKRKFFILLGIQFICNLVEILILSEERKTLIYIAFVWYSLLYSRMKQLHIIFYVDMLNRYFDILNDQVENLRELLDCNEKLMNEKYEKFLAKRFATYHKYLRILHMANQLINKCNEPFLFIHHQNIFVCVSSSLYWTIFRLYNQKENISTFLVFNCLSSILILLIQFLTLTDSCEKVVSNAKILSGAVHDIKVSRKMKDSTLDDAIENLSLDILHSDFTCSVSGYFVINYNLFAQVSCSFRW